MRSPGRRAAPRHGAPSVAARCGRPRPRAQSCRRRGRGRRRGSERRQARVRRRGAPFTPALRRLVLTPTFSAGLGVVVAAFLAATCYRTVLRFSAPIPGNDAHRPAAPSRNHGGTLASALPGVHIRPGRPAASGPAGLGGVAPQPRPGAAARSPAPGSRRRASPIGGSGTGRAGSPTGSRSRFQRDEGAAWTLALGYPGARIAGVQGARWEPGSPGGGVAQGITWPGWGQPQNS